MRNFKHEYLLFSTIIIICVFLTGCPQAAKIENFELNKVAKNWCTVLRASQVIPVYPITEDIKPGDVFLAENTFEKEAEKYNKDGYLPLDLLIIRLNPDNYKTFYNEDIKFKKEEENSPKPNILTNNVFMLRKVDFPEYSFNINNTSRIGMSLPIFSKQITAGALNIEEATVTVKISNAYTYGLDYKSLSEKLSAPGNKTLFEKFAPKNGKNLYLRIVGRVYLAEQLTVLIQENKAKAAGAIIKKDGKSKNQTDKNNKPENEQTFKQKAEEMIKTTLEGNDLPLANIKVEQIQDGTIKITTNFSKPLVFGYLAYDVKILCEGELSAPISTFSRLTGEIDLKEINNIVIIQKMYEVISKRYDSQIINIKNELDQLCVTLLPEKVTFKTCSLKMNNGQLSLECRDYSINGTNFQALIDFISSARDTIDSMNYYARTNILNADEIKNLQDTEYFLQKIICQLSKERCVSEAIDLFLYGNFNEKEIF